MVDGRVLLGHRRPDKHAHPNAWDLPGGVVEQGESELDALARELHEELGVRIATDSVTLLSRVSVGSPQEPANLSAWLVREWRGLPENVAPEEHTSLGWFGAEDLPPLVHPCIRASVMDVLR